MLSVNEVTEIFYLNDEFSKKLEVGYNILLLVSHTLPQRWTVL